MYIDAASGLVQMDMQVSMGANKLSCESTHLNNGCMIWLVFASTNITATVVFMTQLPFVRIVLGKIKGRASVVLGLNIRMQSQKEAFN